VNFLRYSSVSDSLYLTKESFVEKNERFSPISDALQQCFVLHDMIAEKNAASGASAYLRGLYHE
jgi:hypothetical protein